MDDLVQWLGQQLDEDERIARAASGATVVGEPGSWQPSPFGDEWEASRSDDGDEELLVALRPGLPRPPDVLSGYWGAVFSDRPDDAEPDAASPMPAFEHAARHDPARVLREIDAKRQLIADFLSEKHEVVEDCWYTCSAATEERDGGETCDDNRRGGPCDCGRNARVARRLRLLALPYADRPGYAEAIASAK